MISDNLSSITIRSYRGKRPQPNQDAESSYDDFVINAFELSEISLRAVGEEFPSARSSDTTADRAGIFGPSPTEDKLAFVLQMDGALTRWQHSLPAHLRYGSMEHLRDEISTRQATVLHLR